MICNNCGESKRKEFYKNNIKNRKSNLRKKCSQKSKVKVIKPPKKELLIFRKNNSYKTIGEKFGVSDNTVRKWFKSYGLI